MPDDENRRGPRIGGWVPPYRDAPGPAAWPERSRTIPGRLAAAASPAAQTLSPVWRHRWVIVLGFTVVLLAAVLGYLNGARGPKTDNRGLVPGTPLFSPEPAVSLLPAPSATPSFSLPPYTQPVSTNLPFPAGAGRATTKRPVTPATRTRTASPPPSTGLVSNATVSLEPVDHPGLRVRHRDYRGRIDAIRSRLDRADSAFIVRNGLSNARCVSFESTNYTGYFLRHRNFTVYLEKWDSSSSYPQDATFCPRSGGAVNTAVLESVNFPGRFLHIRNDQLFVDRESTVFRVRPPV
jgi:Alpha-L-arabinofuranosidase B (ABFB) domain